MRSLPALLCLAVPVLAAAPQIRVGLDTQALEWIVSLEGGGEVRSLEGRRILKVAEGEKLRIWWDSRGEADPTDEYRVQVGTAMNLADATAVMKKLATLGERPDRVEVPDGGTWRVLTGRFESAREAEPILEKLAAQGYDELWVSTEKRKGAPRKARALYAVTERYERLALPNAGVLLAPARELTTIVGKGRYRGAMRIFPNAQGRLSVVNTLDLETYLRGVVPREMGAWEYPALEALKAQAVAARTYAFVNLGKRAKDGFDLLDTVADQVYGGRDGEQALTDRAVAETAGLIATYGGRPIQALFMADSGGATIDNTFVFGDGSPYLKGVSNYAAAPQTITFKGALEVAGDTPWLTTELLRLCAAGLVPSAFLDTARMTQPARVDDLRATVAALASRLGRAPVAPERNILLWLARSLGFADVVDGQERPEDARYFLGDAVPGAADQPLASFLARRGIAPPALWRTAPTLGQALQVLGRLWQELEPAEFLEGTLLRDGQVRVKNGGPGPLPLAPAILVAEEAPGGSLRLVAESAVQVGDRVRWTPVPGGSPLLVRRLDPDGTALDRYNPTAHWKVEIKEADLLDRLRTRAGIKAVRGFELTHNPQGRVTDMVVRDGQNRPHRFRGMHIRNLLGLKDNVFRMTTVGEAPTRRWVIYGRGWGHGVGMDQTGAYGMALEGATFDGILKHYYQGIQITPIGE
ncbi:SpoIID/LytB domain-containing protein [Geothrix sp. 21YS21S-2]|uniref:SpoIID/LytB domain-containing protein n=1 Tax=Geothrix sp. 21YS21S-2 TaxID=3068893 RepID=UPI0027BAB709|nr:SpoIID/LytB domain-containing protein [Geothrix sp. 21YS21S-2]